MKIAGQIKINTFVEKTDKKVHGSTDLLLLVMNAAL